MTTQHDNAKAAFQQASVMIEQSGIGTKFKDWLEDHRPENLPPLDLDATVALTGWLAAALAGLPLTEPSVTNLVNLCFDE